MREERPIVVIVGPTAGGKSALAIELAHALPGGPGSPGGGECISADSMQVYRGMDIGTAKATPEERARTPHHLIDLVDAGVDGFTVDTWLDRANKIIARLHAAQRWPIVVGGTNLYVQALLEGMFEGPPPDATRRAALEATEQAALRATLERVDPATALRIHPADRKRTIRAVEVFEQTGRPISSLQEQWSRREPRQDVRIVGLEYPVEAINRRINARVRGMIEAGLVDEVRALLARGPLGRQAREALGYKQVIEHLEGRMSLEEAIEQIKIRTRRYAKQQRTWLRRFRIHPRAMFFPAHEVPLQELVQKALGFVLDRRRDRHMMSNTDSVNMIDP